MQVAAARFYGARRIVTRDLKDFVNSPIPAVSPGQALAELVDRAGGAQRRSSHTQAPRHSRVGGNDAAPLFSGL